MSKGLDSKERIMAERAERYRRKAVECHNRKRLERGKQIAILSFLYAYENGYDLYLNQWQITLPRIKNSIFNKFYEFFNGSRIIDSNLMIDYTSKEFREKYNVTDVYNNHTLYKMNCINYYIIRHMDIDIKDDEVKFRIKKNIPFVDVDMEKYCNNKWEINKYEVIEKISEYVQNKITTLYGKSGYFTSIKDDDRNIRIPIHEIRKLIDECRYSNKNYNIHENVANNCNRELNTNLMVDDLTSDTTIDILNNDPDCSRLERVDESFNGKNQSETSNNDGRCDYYAKRTTLPSDREGNNNKTIDDDCYNSRLYIDCDKLDDNVNKNHDGYDFQRDRFQEREANDTEETSRFIIPKIILEIDHMDFLDLIRYDPFITVRNNKIGIKQKQEMIRISTLINDMNKK